MSAATFQPARSRVRRSCVAFALLCLAAGAGCVPTNKTATDLARLESSLGDLRSFQAEQTTEIATLKSELRALSGRVEELEFSQNQRLGKDLTTLKDDLSSLRQRVPPPPIVPLPALEADEALAKQLPQEPGRLLGDALQLIREGKFREAMPMLQSGLDQSYNNDYAANMLFWMGVASDGLGDNKGSLRAYNELASSFSKNPTKKDRIPLALMRQASVFVRLGDGKAAALTLKKLIADFPKAPEVPVAKQKLKDLGPSSR